MPTRRHRATLKLANIYSSQKPEAAKPSFVQGPSMMEDNWTKAATVAKKLSLRNDPQGHVLRRYNAF